MSIKNKKTYFIDTKLSEEAIWLQKFHKLLIKEIKKNEGKII
jgi:hypothetical protein